MIELLGVMIQSTTCGLEYSLTHKMCQLCLEETAALGYEHLDKVEVDLLVLD